MAKDKKANPFTAASDALGLDAGVDALFGAKGNGNEYDADIALTDIEIVPQVRTVFEDEDNKLSELGQSLRTRQLQNIVVCLNLPDREKPFRLVAGERRVRAAVMEGLPTLRAHVFEMTSDEAEAAQEAENVHRMNLAQLELAIKVKRDLDKPGATIESVLATRNKGRAWLSKILAVLDLPKETARLMSSGTTADLEVLNTVKTIEKVAPEKAKKLVDDLVDNSKKKGAEKAVVREVVAKVKDEVKPSKAKKEAVAKAAATGPMASPKDRSQEEPSAGAVFSGAKKGSKTPQQILSHSYSAIFDERKRPASVLEALSDAERDEISEWLQVHFEAGKKVKGLGRVVIEGIRKGVYSTDGEGAMALVALLNGAEGGASFDMLNIFGAVK